MKLKFILLISLCILFARMGFAKDIPAGAVAARDVDIVHTDNNFFVKMTLDLSACRGMDRDREIVVTPLIAGETDTVALPPLVVAGRARYYHWMREKVADRPAAEIYLAGKTGSAPYQASVPYRPWMRKSSVILSSQECGCCGKPGDLALTPVKEIDMTPPPFTPEFVLLTPQESLVKEYELKGSAYVDFPVNRTELYPDYRRNPAELAKINASIDSLRTDSDITLRGMSFKGFASPEGSYANNVRLAKGRTATIKDYVLRQHNFPSNLMTTSYEPEDWEGLRRYVAGSDIENRDAILEIIDSSLKPDPKNDAIRKRFPAQYAFLIKEVYPGLRHTDYTVEYVVRNYTDIEEIKALIFSAPQKLSLAEMFAGASAMQPDSPRYREAFMIAARQFPDEEVANLNAAMILLKEGDTAGAAPYLRKAGNSPEATYARGVLEGMQGNFPGARALLERAAGMGLSEAAHALDNIILIEEALKF